MSKIHGRIRMRSSESHMLSLYIKIIFSLVYLSGYKHISLITVGLLKRILIQSLCVSVIIAHHDIPSSVRMITPTGSRVTRI